MGLLGELKAADKLAGKLKQTLKDISAGKGMSLATERAQAGNDFNIPLNGGRDVLGNVVADSNRSPSAGGRSGGGGSGQGRFERVLRSLDGSRVAGETYLEAFCERTTIVVPTTGGDRLLGGGSVGGSKEIEAWKCPDGQVYPISGSGLAPIGSGAGSGTGSGSVRRAAAPVAAGASPTPSAGFPGPKSITSPDVAQLDATMRSGFQSVVQAIRGDGGASLRLSGGI